MNQWMLIKMQKTRVKCDYAGCDRSYCSYFNLKRHIESSHMGVRKFKCPTCGKSLSSKQNYIDHQNIHTSAKPYLCEHSGCFLRFRQLSQFYLHQKIHFEVPDNPGKTSNNDEIFLSILADKLAKDPIRFYTIPLLPYSVDKIQLPSIVQCENENVVRLFKMC